MQKSLDFYYYLWEDLSDGDDTELMMRDQLLHDETVYEGDLFNGSPAADHQVLWQSRPAYSCQTHTGCTNTLQHTYIQNLYLDLHYTNFIEDRRYLECMIQVYHQTGYGYKLIFSNKIISL